MKREVATQHYRVGFPWSKCQVIIPGDKSLYRTKYFCLGQRRVSSAIREADFGGITVHPFIFPMSAKHTDECTVTACRTEI